MFPFVVFRSSSLVPFLAILIAALPACSEPPATKAQRPRSNASVQALASLIDPAKLDTLKSDRAANPRLRKACYWLHVAQVDGITPGSVIDATGHVRTPRGQLAKESLLRNLTILERLGCLTEDNLAKLRRGRAPTITRGPYAGEQAEVDHIVPVSKAPRFENWIGNLEFMPRTLNRRKSNKMGERQKSHLAKLLEAE
ncbi:hypothetical protein OAG85_03625 [Verrucomicrobiales bacterium]|nr:hypothetical protein [bacterium]MDB4809000.1 hypothetical protein [Verrucomicrobiales bacterium]